VTDPKGGIRFLWPLFGISNQLLAGIALTVATGIIIKMGRVRYAWVTGLPLIWLAVVCTTAAVIKVFSPNPEIGFWAGADALAQQLAGGLIPAEKVAETWAQVVAFRIDAALAFLFATLLWVVIFDMLRVSLRFTSGKSVLPLAESGYVRSRLGGERLSVAAAH
jgi:carbon starvation protein